MRSLILILTSGLVVILLPMMGVSAQTALPSSGDEDARRRHVGARDDAATAVWSNLIDFNPTADRVRSGHRALSLIDAAEGHDVFFGGIDFTPTLHGETVSRDSNTGTVTSIIDPGGPPPNTRGCSTPGLFPLPDQTTIPVTYFVPGRPLTSIYTWTPSTGFTLLPGTGIQPTPVNGTMCVWSPLDGNFYRIGGINSSFQVLNEIWCFNPRTGVWTKLNLSGPAWPGTADGVAFAFGRYIGVIYGVDTSFNVTDRSWAIDLLTNTITEIVGGTRPPPLQAPAMVMRPCVITLEHNAPDRRVCTTLSGGDGNGTSLDGTWDITASDGSGQTSAQAAAGPTITFTQVQTSGPAPARDFHVAWFHPDPTCPGKGRMVIHGGISRSPAGAQFLGDYWQLALSPAGGCPPPPTRPPTPTSGIGPTFTPFLTTHTLTPTPSLTATPTRTRTPTATTPVSGGPGGRALAISSGGSGVSLNWQAGVGQAGYLVARLAGGVLTLLPLEGPLGPTATFFTDATAPPGLDCYVVLPQGTNARSDLECALVGFRSAVGSPENFTLRLDQSSTATLSWAPPAGGGQDSYLLITLGGSPQTIPGTTTNVSLPANGFTCFAVGAQSGGALMGYADILCGQPGFSTLGSSFRQSS